jgi:predicted molibdopterin-dependent oxidoreductase YjgC
MAHVVFPAVSGAEKDGTYINCERRIQRVRTALPRYGDARPDGEIFCAVAQHLGVALGTANPAQVLEEIGTLVPQCQGLTLDALPAAGVQLSWDGASAVPDNQGKPVQRAQLIAVAGPELPIPSADFPYVLLTGASLFHSGSLTTKSKAICTVQPEAIMDMSPADSRALGIASGDTVNVASAQGSITITARVTAKQNSGSVFIPHHFAPAPAHELTAIGQPLTMVSIKKQTA